MGHTPTDKSGGEVLKKGGRAAQIKIGFARYAKLLEDCHAQPAGSIEVIAQPVGSAGPAVLDVAAGIGQLREQIACFSGKGMIQVVARSVNPPDRSRLRLCC